jgi:hypothetical protein
MYPWCTLFKAFRASSFMTPIHDENTNILRVMYSTRFNWSPSDRDVSRQTKLHKNHHNVILFHDITPVSGRYRYPEYQGISGHVQDSVSRKRNCSLSVRISIPVRKELWKSSGSKYTRTSFRKWRKCLRCVVGVETKRMSGGKTSDHRVGTHNRRHGTTDTGDSPHNEWTYLRGWRSEWTG